MCEIYHYDIMSILKWTFRFGLNLGAQPTYSESVGHFSKTNERDWIDRTQFLHLICHVI